MNPQTTYESEYRATNRSQNRLLTGKGGARSPGFRFVIRLIVATCANCLLIACFGGCQSTSKLPPQTAVDQPGALAPGDVVKLVFPGAPDLSQSQRIRVDGKVSLPLVGEVTAAGKRLGDFQEEVSRLYKTQLKNNEVMVSLEASAIPVYVTGAVGRPGRISLDRPMTVLEAIMEAGGLSNLGTLKGVVVIRNANGQHLTQTFDLSPALKGKKVEAFYLKPYDMINVPERFF